MTELADDAERSGKANVGGEVVWVWQVSWELEDQESAASTMALTLEHILCTDGKDDAAWYASSLKRSG
jgi:hypothetical protein